jgi:uncharacterized protein (DUF433 family)
MARTITATEAARLLRVDPKTLRKRLSPRYRGPDRIRGAGKNGRDWRIPAKEVERLLNLQKERRPNRSVDRYPELTNEAVRSALEIANDGYWMLTDRAEQRVFAAARKFSDPETGGGGADLRELREAVMNYDYILVGAVQLLEDFRTQLRG